MAWTLRGFIRLGIGFGCVLATAACDDSGSDSEGAPTGSSTSGGMSNYMTVPIPFENGWAPLNDVGIQGAFFTYDDNPDGGTSVITPYGGGTDFSMAGMNQVCVTGTGAKVELGSDGMPAYGVYWGAGIGFNLSQESGGDPLSYNATAQTPKVIGFAFDIGGTNPLPSVGSAELRFDVQVAGDTTSYCWPITATGTNEFLFTDIHKECWNKSTTEPTPDPANLQAIRWQYATTDAGSYEFDLCVSNIRAIVEG